jgi:hypothetical protein
MCPGRWEDIPTAYGNESQNGKEDLQQSIGLRSDVADTESKKCTRLPSREKEKQSTTRICGEYSSIDQWQKAVSSVCRVTDGVSERSHRIRALGNAVVPQQAKEAFKILMGFK